MALSAKKKGGTISRVLSRMVIYPDLPSPAGSSNPPEADGPCTEAALGGSIASVRSCFGWGLHVPPPLPGERWSLTPPFHPYRIRPRKGTVPMRRLTPAVYFCCTVLGVTSTGCYPASCPVKPGLSSTGIFRPTGRDHLSHL